MLEQAVALREEGDELYELLRTLDDTTWRTPTPFKSWTVNDVVQHLHGTDRMAVLSLTDEQGFLDRATGRAKREPAPAIEGGELLETWREYFLEMCELLGGSDPDRRVKWFGPDMGVRMFTTARQMETWAHGQDVYDLVKRRRTNTDRIRNIVVIGVRTYSWTFANRGLEPPGPAPYVVLSAPSGAVWTYNDPQLSNRVEGSAVEFCHVVTQGRNIADTALTVTGEPARQWMSIAQCFAGPPEDPPAPGTRSDR